MPEAPPRPAGLSADERAIVAAVDGGNIQALALLERVVNINSGTRHLAGVKEVGSVFAAELGGLGFRTLWVDGAAFGRAGHLIAERPGRGPKILLVGHIDTVFEPDSPFQRFERLGQDTARGPGVIDMKGGDVIVLAGLRALAAVGGLDRFNLVVALMGDEESIGEPQALARAG